MIYAGMPLRSSTNTYARIFGTGLLAVLAFVCSPSLSWALQISPSSLLFSATQGGANPPAQTVSLSKFGTKQKTWTASGNMPWLTITPASGTISTETDTITVSPNITGLAAGSYSATVTITLKGVNGSQRYTMLPVSLSVTSTSPTSSTPVISLTPSMLNFTGIAGGSNPSPQSITVSNTGGGTLNWTAADNATWLTISPTTGTNTGTIAASVNLAGLAAGTYTGIISISATGATTQTVSVTLTVSSSTSSSVIGLSPTVLSFSATAGGSNPTSQTITVSNTGTGTLSWTASDSAAWLTLSPTTGTNAGTIAASVNTTGLAAGTYSATVTVSATGATTKTLPVTLNLTSASTGTATLSWTANTDTDLAGYKVYVGTQSGVYGAPVTLGKVTTYQISNLTLGTTYFFSITAYDSAGNESLHSGEVSKSIF